MAGPSGKPGPGGTIIPIGTRMAPRVAPPTTTDAARTSRSEARQTRTIAKAALAKRPRYLRAVVRAVDDQFKIRCTFSRAYGADAGKVWSEPLQLDRDLDAGQEFFWRTEIDQFRVDPLLQGFRTTWALLTAGWTFVDGLRSASYDEAISNPLSIIRVIRAPATIPSSPGPLFRVVVTSRYRP